MNLIFKQIKNNAGADGIRQRICYGRLAGIVGICANLFLFAVKITIGILFSSLSVIADAMNNFADAGSSILTLIGYLFAGKPADKEHPYGHARMEYLCGLFISVIVTVFGIETLTSSIEKLFSGEGSAVFTTSAIIIMASTAIVKIIIAVFYTKIGKIIGSASLRASAVDSISDVAATGAVVIGMLLTPITGPKTDSVLGIVIAVYIIVMGIKLIAETSNTLLGTAPDADLIKQVIEKIRSYDGVLGIHDLVVHSYGADRCFASVHVEMDADRDIMLSHDCIDNIEADFVKDMNINLVIHLDPVCTSDPVINEMRERMHMIVSDIASEYGAPISMHDFRMVIGMTHTNIIFDISVSSDMILTDTELCSILTSRIKKINPSYNAVITIDRDYMSHRYGKR